MREDCKDALDGIRKIVQWGGCAGELDGGELEMGVGGEIGVGI